MKTILLIEDEFPIRNLIRELLETNNYKVFTASDGVEGIQLAKEINPDMILCDIVMPGFNGHQVIEILKEEKILPFIPFIFLTAKSNKSDFRDGMDLGADDYITKPFKALDLLKIIEIRLAKAEEVRNQNNISDELSSKKEKLKENGNVLLNVNNNPQLIIVSDILYIKAKEEYSEVFTTNGQKYLVRKLLKQWEDQLPDSIFQRIHRSTIINFNQIDKIEKWYNRSYVVYLKKTTEKFIISQRYTSKIKLKLSV